jgi:hypothetical protein
MADTFYNPTFKHVDWIDNEDIVQAAGENGFNGRFHALETEFASLSKVIANINAAIGPVAPTVTLALSPIFFTNDNAAPWTFAEQSTNATLPLQVGSFADAFLPIQLPDGAKVQSITIFGGTLPGNELFFELCSQPLDSGSFRVTLTRVSVPPTTSPANFEVTSEVSSNLGSVDNSINRYFAFARVTRTSADADLLSPSIRGIRIVYAKMSL